MVFPGFVCHSFRQCGSSYLLLGSKHHPAPQTTFPNLFAYVRADDRRAGLRHAWLGPADNNAPDRQSSEAVCTVGALEEERKIYLAGDEKAPKNHGRLPARF